MIILFCFHIFKQTVKSCQPFLRLKVKVYTLEKVALYTSFCHRFCFYEINGSFGFFHGCFDSFTLVKQTSC